jgi:hypothetical protein
VKTLKKFGLSTRSGHERQVYDVLKAELEKVGSKSLPDHAWDRMNLASRAEWLESELVHLQAKVQAAATFED